MESLGKNVLLYGCGGGFDIFNAFFLYHELTRRGHIVHLANYSFTDDLYRYTPNDSMIVEIHGNEERTKKNTTYFPESDLALHLNQSVYAVRLHGPNKVLPEMQALCDSLSIDSLVLVDGGHDAIIFGDESSWGSPLEDTSSIIMASQLHISSIFVVCISATTECMHWPTFEVRAKTLCTTWNPSSSKDEKEIKSFESLLDSTDAQCRSIPNECLLAGMQGHRSDHYKNPRLIKRLGEHAPIEEWPPIMDETAYHYFVPLNKLLKSSTFYQWIMKRNCKTLQDINHSINVFQNTTQ